MIFDTGGGLASESYQRVPPSTLGDGYVDSPDRMPARHWEPRQVLKHHKKWVELYFEVIRTHFNLSAADPAYVFKYID